MDGGAWWATVQGVAKSRTQLINFTSLSLCRRLHNVMETAMPKRSMELRFLHLKKKGESW